MHKRLIALLKKRSFILSAIVVAVLLGLTLAVLSLRAAIPQPKTVGQIKPEDIRDIRRTISGAQWHIARTWLKKREYRRLLRFYFRDLAGRRFVEISARAGPAGDTALVQGPTVSYMLLRATNGWQMTAWGAHK